MPPLVVRKSVKSDQPPNKARIPEPEGEPIAFLPLIYQWKELGVSSELFR
jgi:hypothetical protein